MRGEGDPEHKWRDWASSILRTEKMGSGLGRLVGFVVEGKFISNVFYFLKYKQSHQLSNNVSTGYGRLEKIIKGVSQSSQGVGQ